MESKKKLTVVFANNKIDDAVVKFLNKMYDLTIVKNYTKNSKDKIAIPELIIFTGGEDVSPEIYGEKKGSFTNSNSTRDVEEKLAYDLQRGFNNEIPKLGICRGAQFLTVMNGGRLIQHVEGHTNISHTIQLDKGGIIKLMSDHHQMMFPYNLNKKSYKLIGFSEKHLSTVYLDGNDKNFELSTPYFEAEIVYYPHTNSFCIQAHPEWEVGSRDSYAVLRMIDKYLFNKTKSLGELIYDPYPGFEEDFEIHEDQEVSIKPKAGLGLQYHNIGIENPEKSIKKGIVSEKYNYDSYGKRDTSTLDNNIRGDEPFSNGDTKFSELDIEKTNLVSDYDNISKGMDTSDVIERLIEKVKKNE